MQLSPIAVAAGVCQVIYLATAFVLALHLARRARRGGDLAPLLLGIQLFFAMGVGYALCSAGAALALLAPEPQPERVAALLGPGNAAVIVGLSAALVFEWRVFWPAARWPRWLGGAFVAVMLAGWFGSAATGAFETGLYRNGWFLLLNAGMLSVNLWVGIEPLVYHAKLVKRVRLGLAEPLVVDRFLLWGLGSLARAALVLLGPVSELALARLEGEARLTASAIAAAVACGLALATTVAYWLTFEPTPRYVRWVERRYRRSRA
jgi:hypothetical protein